MFPLHTYILSSSQLRVYCVAENGHDVLSYKHCKFQFVSIRHLALKDGPLLVSWCSCQQQYGNMSTEERVLHTTDLKQYTRREICSLSCIKNPCDHASALKNILGGENGKHG